MLLPLLLLPCLLPQVLNYHKEPQTQVPATPSSPHARILASNTSAPASSEQTIAPQAPPKPPLGLVAAPDPTSTPGPLVGLEPAPALPTRSLRSGARRGGRKPCSITQRQIGGGDLCVGGFVCNFIHELTCSVSKHCQECRDAGCPDGCRLLCMGGVSGRRRWPTTCPQQTPSKCSDITGSYTRSFDKAWFGVSQSGCTAHFRRLNGTAGRPAYSAIVEGTKVAPHQSAPGYVQANGDIKFLSGVVYAKFLMAPPGPVVDPGHGSH